MRNTIFAVLLFVTASASLTLAQGTYERIDVPGAIWTFCTGLNTAGDVIGYYSDGSHYHGFLSRGGSITTLDIAGSQNTYALGINDVGQIVGGTDTNGFLYDIPTQTVTSLEYPRSGSRTTPYSINNAGIIVGDISHGGEQVGFEFDGTIYTIIKTPGSTLTLLSSINNLGEALGRTISQQSVTTYFLLNQGKRTKLANSDDLAPWGINDTITIVGSRKVKLTALAGFVRQANLRRSLRFPGSSTTVAMGINNSGVVVGWFKHGEGTRRIYDGFLWTPPADTAKK